MNTSWHHPDPPTSFDASVALVSAEIKNIKELCRSPHAKRLSFVTDVCLVAHGVRTGHLVDAVYPPNPVEVFRALLTTLRRKSPVFEAVVFWHHAPSVQSFFVHATLLQEKITTLLGGVSEVCVIVKLGKRPSASRDLPDALREALGSVRLAMTEDPDALVLYLSELFTGEILIPLAAVLIDYPVAYLPVSPTQTTFLEGEPLDVYTVSFKWTTRTPDCGLDEHGVLLKFSCPQVLAADYPELLPSTMIKKLHVKFAIVLEHLGAIVFVTHSTATLDRVAL